MVYKNIRDILILIVISIWLAIFSVDNKLHIIACDVGQGDAILVQRLNTQILIDGGPNEKVIDCLSKHMPFYDRQIELVILTHPQSDHYTGLINVFKRYKVNYFGEYNRESSSVSYLVLRNEVGGQGTKTVTLVDGMGIRLGMIYLDVLAHSKDQGVVTLLNYKNYKALFMADVENKISDEVAVIDKIKEVDYIKVNHHGSKNGITENLIKIARPKQSIISVGKNSYGHPSQEVIDMLTNQLTKILRTDVVGDIDINY